MDNMKNREGIDKVFVENIQEEVLDKELRERFPLNIEGPNMPLETLVSI